MGFALVSAADIYARKMIKIRAYSMDSCIK